MDFAYTLNFFYVWRSWMVLQEIADHFQRKAAHHTFKDDAYCYITHPPLSGWPVCSLTALSGFYHSTSSSDCYCHFWGVKFKSSWCLFSLLKSPLPLQMQPFPSQHRLCFQSFLNGPHIEEFISFLCRKIDCHDLTMNSKAFLIVKASPNVLQWSWTTFPSLRQGQCGHIIKCFQ